MNYGFGPESKGWIAKKETELASRLGELCNSFIDDRGMFPYVEIDGMYPGVRIRRITHLADEERETLVKKADEIYREVMQLGDDDEQIL